MFRRLPEAIPRATVAFTFDGRTVLARDGDTIACALLAAGLVACRTTPVSGASRAPYCLMGACFECLVMIDGRPGRQACMTAVQAGMQVETQQGGRQVKAVSGPAA